LEKNVFVYLYLMDVSRRCVRISAAEINIIYGTQIKKEFELDVY